MSGRSRTGAYSAPRRRNPSDVSREPEGFCGCGLVVADLDGTLVTGTTAGVHLDDWIGHGPVIEDLEGRFAAGEITNT